MTLEAKHPLICISVWFIIIFLIVGLAFYELFNLIGSDKTQIDKGIISSLIGGFVIIMLIVITMVAIRPIIERLHDNTVEFELLANIDPLTGLNNRRAFNRAYQAEVNMILRDKAQACSMILLDIDDFKLINDTFGHDIGDEVLVGLAKCLSSNVRCSDVVARIGGEEFVILLPSTLLPDAVRLAENLREITKVTAKNFTQSSTPKVVTISGGVILIEEHEELKHNLAYVDKLLYRAKKNGKDCIES